MTSLSTKKGIFFLEPLVSPLGFTSAFLWNLFLLMGEALSRTPNFVRCARCAEALAFLRKNTGFLRND